MFVLSLKIILQVQVLLYRKETKTYHFDPCEEDQQNLTKNKKKKLYIDK